jgi:hypothetical protein
VSNGISERKVPPGGHDHVSLTEAATLLGMTPAEVRAALASEITGGAHGAEVRIPRSAVTRLAERRRGSA